MSFTVRSVQSVAQQRAAMRQRNTINQRIRRDFLRNEIYPAATDNFQGLRNTEDDSFDFNTETEYTGNRHNLHRRAAQRYSVLGGPGAILPDESNIDEISIRCHDCAALHFPGETVGQSC